MSMRYKVQLLCFVCILSAQSQTLVLAQSHGIGTRALNVFVEQRMGAARGFALGLRQEGSRCFGMQANPREERIWVSVPESACNKLLLFIDSHRQELSRERVGRAQDLAFGPGTPEAMMQLSGRYFQVRLVTARSCDGSGQSCDQLNLSMATRVASELRLILFQIWGSLPRPEGLD